MIAKFEQKIELKFEWKFELKLLIKFQIISDLSTRKFVTQLSRALGCEFKVLREKDRRTRV